MIENDGLDSVCEVLQKTINSIQRGELAPTDVVIVLLERKAHSLGAAIVRTPHTPKMHVSEILHFASAVARPKHHKLMQSAFLWERKN